LPWLRGARLRWCLSGLQCWRSRLRQDCSSAPSMGAILEVKVLPRADHSERRGVQLREGEGPKDGKDWYQSDHASTDSDVRFGEASHLNPSNRLVRTRMPGGVAGVEPNGSPYADRCSYRSGGCATWPSGSNQPLPAHLRRQQGAPPGAASPCVAKTKRTNTNQQNARFCRLIADS
jgi:hypothetical protein